MMLPDFPRAKQQLNKVFITNLKHAVEEKSNLTGGLITHRKFEGERLITDLGNGIIDAEPYITSRVGVEVSTEVLIKEGFLHLLNQQDVIAQQIIDDREKHFMRRIDGITEATGQVVRNTEPFVIEHFLDMLERMPIDFDENGRPITPRAIIHPEQAVRWKDQFQRLDHEPELQLRVKKLLEVKEAEFVDRESNRVLVD